VSEVLYLAIVDSIKKSILKQEYQPGDMLDSEASLMKKFGASRMTIRKSLSLLSNEGYIYSVPGKGCFVCKPEANLYQFRFNKYEDLALPIDNVRLLDVSVVKGAGGNDEIREKLGLRGKSGSVLKVSRLLLSGKENVAVEYIYFAYKPNKPVVEEQLKFANHLEAIERKFAFSLEKTLRVSCGADAGVRSLLGCGAQDSVFCLQETVSNSGGSGVYSYTEFYVLPRNFTLCAVSAPGGNGKDETSAKRIF